MPAPATSVVIPTFNRAHYVGDAIESVLTQTYQPVELIVVDNASTDGTADVVADFGDRVRFVRMDQQSIGAARNTGVALATGAFLSFLDDDDLWVADKLAIQMRVFDTAPQTDVVYGRLEQFVSPELDASDRARFQHLDGQVLDAPLPTAMLIRRAAWDRVGPFDESLRLGVEMEWYARLGAAGLNAAMLDAVVYRRRIHRTNINVTRAHEQGERLRVLKQLIDRRRAEAAQPS